MDGPNVNWKLLELLQEHRIENDPLAPDSLSIGSCGLHILHSAFNTGQNSTCWQLAKVIKNCYSIFNKSSTRRADYLAASNMQETMMAGINSVAIVCQKMDLPSKNKWKFLTI